jgi:glutaconate CoA-transferase subunit B
MNIRSLHPGVTVEQVQENTSFPLHVPANIPTTALPTVEQLALLNLVDPHNLRATALG